MESMNRSSSSDIYYVNDVDENVKVYQSAEPGEENKKPDEPIYTDDLSSTANLSEREELTQVFSDQSQQKSAKPLQYKQFLRPNPNPGNDASDLEISRRQSGSLWAVRHNWYATGDYSTDCTLKCKD